MDPLYHLVSFKMLLLEHSRKYGHISSLASAKFDPVQNDPPHRKVAGSGFHRLREASKAIVSEMTQERERRLAAIKKERAAVRKENEDRLEKFSRAGALVVAEIFYL